MSDATMSYPPSRRFRSSCAVASTVRGCKESGGLEGGLASSFPCACVIRRVGGLEGNAGTLA